MSLSDRGVVDGEPCRTVVKSIMVLSLLDGQTPASLAMLARLTSIPKSTVRRLLLVLCEQGMAHHVDRGYVLGPLAADLGGKAITRLPDRVLQLIIPHLLSLHSATRGIICLGVLRGQDVVCVRTLHREIDIALVGLLTRPGQAARTALGRALLANRADELHVSESGTLVTLAMGITDHCGTRIAAIGVAGPAGRFSVSSAATHLRAAAHGASRAIRMNVNFTRN